MLPASDIQERCPVYPVWLPHLQRAITAMCLRLTFPVSQSHGEVHRGVAGVSLSGEISSSSYKAEQLLQRGTGSPEWGTDSGDPVTTSNAAQVYQLPMWPWTRVNSENVANRTSTSKVPKARPLRIPAVPARALGPQGQPLIPLTQQGLHTLHMVPTHGIQQWCPSILSGAGAISTLLDSHIIQHAPI